MVLNLTFSESDSALLKSESLDDIEYSQRRYSCSYLYQIPKCLLHINLCVPASPCPSSVANLRGNDIRYGTSTQGERESCSPLRVGEGLGERSIYTSLG
jgi:hypothetical protein